MTTTRMAARRDERVAGYAEGVEAWHLASPEEQEEDAPPLHILAERAAERRDGFEARWSAASLGEEGDG